MSDYARIADAIRFIASQVAHQPTLDEIAAHVHLSPFTSSGCSAAGPG